MATKDKPAPPEEAVAEAQTYMCGLIMPISAIDGMPAEHWLEVRSILEDAVESIPDPKFKVRIVSDADETGIIQKRIVQNVYGSDIIVCDVSGKNPNVMFELGMRLAFDKSVVIVKDDKTDYSFDTGIIEHLTYPRDLRFARIVDFKNALAAKVLATYKAATAPDHSPFLKNFGRFHVASLSQTEVSPERLTLEMLEELRREITRLGRRIETQPPQLSDSENRVGRARARKYIREYLEQNPGKDAASLLLDDEFRIDALRTLGIHFQTMGEFMDALEEAVAFRRTIKRNSDT